MDLFEYQARDLFEAHGVPVLKGAVATTPEEAKSAAASMGGKVVVKAQVKVGGRGKAGGVKLAESPDDAFSLEPNEFKQMIDSVRIVEKTFGRVTYGGVKGEQAIKKFRRSLFFTKDMKKGDIIDKTCVRSVRPGYGLHTKYYWDILGKVVNKDVKFGGYNCPHLLDKKIIFHYID